MKFRQKQQMSIGFVLSYISIAVKMLSGILYTPIVLRSLGQSQYGVYSLCISFIGYLTIFNAGVNAAYIKFYLQEKVKNEKNIANLNGLFKKIFLTLSAVGLIGGLLLSALSPFIFGSKITPAEYIIVRKCFFLLAFTIAVEIYSCLYKSFITANEQFIFGKTVDIIGGVMAPIITLPFLLNGFDCVSIIAVRLVIAILVLFLCMTFCTKTLFINFQYEKQNHRTIKEIIQFISYILIQSVTDQLNWQIDKFILARTHGSTEIALYSVGATLNNYFLLIGTAASGVFIARINMLVVENNKDSLNQLYRRCCKLFTYIIGYIMLAFFVFGRMFILRWAGESYETSYSIGWMLMLPLTWALINALAQEIARASNRHQMLIIMNFAVCIFNSVLSIPLAIKWGAIGSAFGTFIAEFIICIVINPIYYQKKLGIDMLSVYLDFIRYIPGVLFPATFGILLNCFGIIKADYGSIVLYGLAFSVFYFLSIWFISMNKDDREFIMRVFIKN